MKKPRFSIVIALAPWRDAEILSSIKKLKFPKKDFEVIIQKGLNVPTNRNKGAKKARGEIILFLDDDAIIEPDFLEKVKLFFDKNPEVSILGGPQLTPSSDNFFARTNGYALESPFSSMRESKRYKKARLNLNADSSHITGANLICKKSLIRKIKFDKNLYPADDVYLVNRAKKLGFKVAYSPEIYIYHRRRASLKGLIKQIFDYGKSRPQIKAPGEKKFNLLFLIPSIFLLYILLLPTLTLINKIFLIPIILYAIIDLIFSFYEAIINQESKAIFLLPFIFLTIHLSYGAGFLVGLINKIFKQGK